MENRSFEGDSLGYRFGFTGQEKDDEISGIEGGHLSFAFRISDSRLGRFFSVDPLFAIYPWNSPYSFCENSVIGFIELEGLEKYIATVDETAGRVILVLSSEESIQQQQAARIPLVSWDGGKTYSGDFRYSNIQSYYASVIFNEGVLKDNSKVPAERISEPNLPNAEGFKTESYADGKFPAGQTSPPQYVSPWSLSTAGIRTTFLAINQASTFGGFTFGVAGAMSTVMPYVAYTTNNTATFTFTMGSASYPSQIWDITITDQSGNVIYNRTNVNTGGVAQSVDLTSMVVVGSDTWTISVTPSSGTVIPPGAASTSTNYSYDLQINSEVIR